MAYGAGQVVSDDMVVCLKSWSCSLTLSAFAKRQICSTKDLILCWLKMGMCPPAVVYFIHLLLQRVYKNELPRCGRFLVLIGPCLLSVDGWD